MKLDISKEKSQITNLRKRKSDFLGFSLKAVKKNKKYVANTFVMNKKKEKIKAKIKGLILKIQKNPSSKTVNKYNIYVIGIKNYYRYATHVNIDFSKIAYQLSKTLYNRLKSVGKYEIPIKPNENYKKFNKNNYRTFKVASLYLPLLQIYKLKM